MTIKVRVMDGDTVRKVVALLGDAREAICSAMSEGWDVFSVETRDELSGVLECIDQIGKLDGQSDGQLECRRLRDDNTPGPTCGCAPGLCVLEMSP